jgi:hypothetical protein
MNYNEYHAVLGIKSMAGGFPGSLDKINAFLQTPVMARRVPQEAREEFLGREAQFDSSVAEATDGADDVADSYIRTGFRMLNGKYILAAHQIKAMLQNAAEALYDRNSRPASLLQMKNAIKRCLEIRPEEIVMNIEGEVWSKTINQIVKHPRYQFPVPINRVRQIVPYATVEFSMLVLDSSIGRRVNGAIIQDLLDAGGMFVGLGTDRGYQHGRFTVIEFETVKSIPYSEPVEDELETPKARRTAKK